MVDGHGAYSIMSFESGNHIIVVGLGGSMAKHFVYGDWEGWPNVQQLPHWRQGCAMKS
jgi:hypothetical protein